MAKDAASEVDSVVQAALEGVATFARTLHARSRCWQLLMAGPVVATWVGAKHGRAHRPDRFEHRLAHEPRRPAAPSAGCCDVAWPAAAPHTECCIGCNEEGNLKARSSQGRHLG